MDKVTELAKMIDHSLLHPTMTDEDLYQGCLLAKKYNVATVCIKPYAIKEALEWLRGSDVLVCAVIGFPQGNSTTAVKVFETEQACIDGAQEIDMVVNIGKVLGEDWAYVEEEIAAIVAVTKKHKAALKVIFENDFLPDDQFKIKLCEICSKLKVEFVKTSTGYGFVKGGDGKYSYEGATEHDLVLMRIHAAPEVQIKAAGGVRTLDDLLKVKALGVTRVGATATAAMLEEAKKRFGGETPDTAFLNTQVKGGY
ncbi:deoxyribose-phosphate aldolase [Mucilaginibacter gotjawali]|uniref:Deoxyribose-phosphate aldolase n=1 Tax=Mucilaginibacter gotjawali TaxID=1550579 RepID=A0A839SRC8_9SPHI|nr:deoxyribose-phosphate aldolase [Mucilaginibacter gotjawali]MBB3058887.1 deoxyribose-phosphate aldolase [Mucilaginibacter gotjawali]